MVSIGQYTTEVDIRVKNGRVRSEARIVAKEKEERSEKEGREPSFGSLPVESPLRVNPVRTGLESDPSQRTT